MKYVLLVLFSPLYLLYHLILLLRHLLYDFKVSKIKRVNTPVISIGNVTVGGTGKTPFTIDIAKRIDNSCVVSRGYKRSSKGLVVVSNRTEVLLDAETGGDEPFMIASNAKVPVICSSDRYEGCMAAEDKFKSRYILLDDGFQHRKLHRDFDIVVVDSPRFFGNGLLLPFGVLRDLRYRVKKCDLILLSKVSNTDRCREQIKLLQERFNKPVIYSKPVYNKIINKSGEFSLDSIDKKVFLFCGIGHPEPFFDAFNGFDVIGKKSYTDHYSYTNEDVIGIIKESNDSIIITTEKDYVKISDEYKDDIFYLKMNNIYYDSNDKEINPADYIIEKLSNKR